MSLTPAVFFNVRADSSLSPIPLIVLTITGLKRHVENELDKKEGGNEREKEYPKGK